MKRITVLICLILSAVILLNACNDANTDEKEETRETARKAQTTEVELSEDMLYIIAGAKARYGIVRANKMSTAGTNACSSLYVAIQTKTGIALQFVDDSRSLDEGVKEILLGNTNREESKKAIAEMGDSHWNIGIYNEKICIVAANDGLLSQAITAFINEYVNVKSEFSSKETIAIPKETSKKEKLTENLHSLNIFEGAKLEVEAQTKFNFNVNKFTQNSATLTWVQGGCSDGEYLYQFMISKDSESCVIVKSHIETQREVKRSEIQNLGHANDAAYNPYTNTLIVADCMAPYYNKVHILDASTLKLTKTVELQEYSAAQLSYDKETRQYITANNSTIYYWDEDFNLIKTCPAKLSIDYHTQGIVSDGTYIYRLEYWQNPDNAKDIKNNLRIIRISDGKQIDLVNLSIAREVECITIHDGMFYICCNNSTWSGSEVYAFNLVLKD